MWIVPKNLPISNYVQDMEASEKELKQLSEMSAQSLMWRSKPSQSQTWLRRWNREKWLQHLYGRILKPSHFESFEDMWISYLGDFLVNRSVPQEDKEEMKTQDTCSPLFLMESSSVDLISLFWRMSKESSQQSSKQLNGETQLELQFCSMSLESWKEWVTERRQCRSARQKSVLPTNEIDGLSSASWPTSSARDWKGCYKTLTRKDGKARGDLLPDAVNIEENGLQGLDNNSTNGSIQGLYEKLTDSWGPPRVGGQEGALSRVARGKDLGLQGQVEVISAVELEKPKTSKLNPRWVETLMGLEIGWCTPSPSGELTNRTDELRLLGNGVVWQSCRDAIYLAMDDFKEIFNMENSMKGDTEKPNKIIWVFLKKSEYTRHEENGGPGGLVGMEGLNCSFAKPRDPRSVEEANSLFLVDAYFEDTDELYSERLSSLKDIATMLMAEDDTSLLEILVPETEIVDSLERHIELIEKYGDSMITYVDRKRILNSKDYEASK